MPATPGRYPDTVHFKGLNTPVRVEVFVHDVLIEGEIPPDIEGALFRAVPDPAYPPMREDEVILSGDGMVSKIEFRGGRVSSAIRYVRTERFLAERAAGRALFGRYRNPYTHDPSVAGVDPSTANTTPVWHAGCLLMTKEDGRPWQVDPHTLDTIGKWDFHGRMTSLTMSAHPKIDPVTGEMFWFGSEADGLCRPTVAYGIAGRDGALRAEQYFKTPYCALMHDFAISEQHAVFPVFPTTADLDRLKSGGPHWIHQQDLESWIGIMPRYGRVDEMLWFKGPPGVQAYHVMNAVTEGNLVHLDMCLTNSNMIPFIREDSGLDIPLDGALVRWTMDLKTPDAGIVERKIGPFGEMPLIRHADIGRDYRRGWYLTIDPAAGKPLFAGPAGVGFNCMLQVEIASGQLQSYSFADGLGINEPVHVPASCPGHGGWLVAVVDREVAENTYKQEVWIFEADHIAKGPVAKAYLPVASRVQVHSCWVPAAQLDQALV